ncbi:MAG: hypothetical protein VX777_10930, partial [Chlamydiota bacterium]|nr:hypothetical protein [Chlamydiota bacterium]
VDLGNGNPPIRLTDRSLIRFLNKIETSDVRFNYENVKLAIDQVKHGKPDVTISMKALLNSHKSKAVYTNKKTVNRNKKIVENFKAKWQAEVKSKYPNLVVSNEQFAEKIEQIMDMGYDLEDHLDLVLQDNDLKDNLANLNVLATKNKKGDTFQHLMSDLLLSTALIPTRVRKAPSTILQKHISVYRQAIEPISPHQLLNIVEDLVMNEGSASYSKYFNKRQLSLLKNKDTTQAQKLMLFSLCNFKNRVKKPLLENPESISGKVFNHIYHQKYLSNWLIATSGSLEQCYINTCVGTVHAQEMLTHAGSVAELLLAGEIALDIAQKGLEKRKQKLEKNEKTLEKKSEKEIRFIESNIKKMRSEYETIANELMNLRDEEVIDPKVVRKIVQKWGKIHEKVGMYSDLDDLSESVRAVVKKPIHNAWLLSAIMMIVPVLVDYFLGSHLRPLLPNGDSDQAVFSPGQVLNGNNRTNINKEFGAPLTEFKEDLSEDVKKTLENLHEKLKSADNIQKLKMMNTLWDSAYRNSGLAVEDSSHCYYLKAVILDGKKVFLLNDPKQAHYQMWSFESLPKKIIGSKLELA